MLVEHLTLLTPYGAWPRHNNRLRNDVGNSSNKKPHKRKSASEPESKNDIAEQREIIQKAQYDINDCLKELFRLFSV